MDALWKPLIRKFRQFIKIQVMHELRYDFDQSKSIPELGYIFGKILKVPRNLLDSERMQMALYVMVESSKITLLRKLATDVEEKLGKHCQSIR